MSAEASLPVLPLKKPILPVIVVSGILALVLSLLHLMRVELSNKEFILDWSDRILSGNSYYPDQYRILSYYSAHALALLGLPVLYSFFAIRLVFTFLSFVVLYLYLESLCRPIYAVLGLLMTAFSMVFTYAHYACQPTDPLNMLVFFTAFHALYQRKDRWLLPLIVIGMLNRETVILLPLIYAFIRYKEEPLKRYVTTFLALSAAAAAIYLGLRLWFGARPPYAATSPLHYWRTNLLDKQTWVQVLS